MASPTNPFDERVVREEPATYLQKIRRDSCYKTLRALITLLAVFFAIGGLAHVAVAIKAFASLPGSQTEAALEIWTIHWRVTFLSALTVLLVGFFTIAVAVAFRQASLVLVDIADMLIDRGRQEWKFGKSDQAP